ncbi:MAG TPA: hypothetical protein VK174_08790, partial [Chitinophagales bacterium]|nr:hypothetical protein [Chitinophagales bacterium]
MGVGKHLLLPLFLFCLANSQAQEDSVYSFKYLDRSTRFAWTTFGADLLVLGGGKSPLEGNSAGEISFGPTIIPRLTIGGVHFWGHGEFYVSFPLPFLSFQNKPEGFKELEYKQGIETGVRVYPLKLKLGKISPYLGASFRLLSYEHEEGGKFYNYGEPKYQKMIFPVQAGLAYTTSKH